MNRRNSVVIIHILGIFDQIFVNFVKQVRIVNGSGIDFVIKDRGGLLKCSIKVFCPEFMQNFSKFRLQ